VSAFRELERKLAEATGPDDALLNEEIFHLVFGRARSISTFEQYEPSEALPRYTSSLDAAVSFAEAMLPDCQWMLKKQHGLSTAAVFKFVQYHGEALNLKSCPALALCLATIRALIARGGE
jgi:hypothetical protein